MKSSRLLIMNYKQFILPVKFEFFYHRSAAMPQKKLLFTEQKQPFSTTFKKSRQLLCLNFVFGDKKCEIFVLTQYFFEGIAKAIAEKITKVSAEKALF